MALLQSLNLRLIDGSRARKKWGWEPLYTDFESIVADFIQEVRTRTKN